MAELKWGTIGEKTYEHGIDRGVLYPPTGLPVVWNGLTGVEEAGSAAPKPYFLEGQKYLETTSPGDFSAKLKAYTYPDAFENLIGNHSHGYGLTVHDQTPKRFGLSYRTGLGNDMFGHKRGYKIHLLYNLLATPDTASYQSRGKSATPTDFSWTLTSIPTAVPGHRPTAHLSLDSTKVRWDLIKPIEDILYGTSSTVPRMPTFAELNDLVFQDVLITDLGDGSWTASGADSNFVLSPDGTEFTILNVDATYSDADTYTVSTTTTAPEV